MIRTRSFLHEHVSVSLDKWEALHILMQYEIELMYTFRIIAFNSFVQYFLIPMIIMWKSGNGQNFFRTANSL